jgi:hypothetical protein
LRSALTLSPRLAIERANATTPKLMSCLVTLALSSVASHKSPMCPGKPQCSQV